MMPVPLTFTFELFDRLRALADREGTSPQFLAAKILDEALTTRGLPMKVPSDDERGPWWHDGKPVRPATRSRSRTPRR